jgi:hypothetical protein
LELSEAGQTSRAGAALRFEKLTSVCVHYLEGNPSTKGVPHKQHGRVEALCRRSCFGDRAFTSVDGLGERLLGRHYGALIYAARDREFVIGTPFDYESIEVPVVELEAELTRKFGDPFLEPKRRLVLIPKKMPIILADRANEARQSPVALSPALPRSMSEECPHRFRERRLVVSARIADYHAPSFESGSQLEQVECSGSYSFRRQTFVGSRVLVFLPCRRLRGHSLGHRMTRHAKVGKLDHKPRCAKLLFCKHYKPSKLVAASS